jgi:NAD(P)-dependent dehydrogenase (short-subunit alcohol dehydrogenase family)
MGSNGGSATSGAAAKLSSSSRAFPEDLTGSVAVVTGASRGAGRGIALSLGERGATVYVTGRTVRGAAAVDGLPGTIDETAELVSARGGVGIPIRTDHTVDREVESLFAEVYGDQRRLDLLVNNVWGGYEGQPSNADFDAPFWEQPLSRWDKMLVAGVRATMVASYFAARLMVPARRGLIVATSLDKGPDDWNVEHHQGGPFSVFYDTAKAAINRMVMGMAVDLSPHRIAVIAISPGWMRTEAVMRANDLTPDFLARTQSVEYVGRAVAALATDRHVFAKTGQIMRVGQLAREYGFVDVDGTQPD